MSTLRLFWLGALVVLLGLLGASCARVDASSVVERSDEAEPALPAPVVVDEPPPLPTEVGAESDEVDASPTPTPAPEPASVEPVRVDAAGSEALVYPDAFNVLYMGHSFGRPFAAQLEEFAQRAGFDDYDQHVVFKGGSGGAPEAMWESPTLRMQIEAFLATGEIDVLIMICCSATFRESQGQQDPAVWEVAEAALEQNPATRIGLALPWRDFPGNYASVADHRGLMDAAFGLWQELAEDLQTDLGTDVFTIYHGDAIHELRERFELGELSDLDQLTGPRETSVFRDQKGHAGQMAIDLGTLMWLAEIRDYDVSAFPAFEEWDLDLRVVAEELLAEQAAS